MAIVLVKVTGLVNSSSNLYAVVKKFQRAGLFNFHNKFCFGLKLQLLREYYSVIALILL